MADYKFKLEYTEDAVPKVTRIDAESKHDAEIKFMKNKGFSRDIKIIDIKEINWTDSEYYFDLSEAFQEAKREFSFGDGADKAKSSAKLLGKTFANVSIFTGKLAVHIAKEAPEILAKRMQEHLDNNPNIPSEQRAKIEESIARTKK